MNRNLFSLLIALIAFTLCKGQEIEMKKVFGGYKYTQNGNKLSSFSKLSSAVKTNTQSLELLKKAQQREFLV